MNEIVNKKRHNKFFLITLSLLAVNACSDESFEKSVYQYCELYNAESLSLLGQNAELQEAFGYILERQEKIKNKKLQGILKSADKSSFSNYYAGVKIQIEKELGKTWSCEDFEQFFLPKQKIVSLSLKGIQYKSIDPQADNTITIMVAHSGDILVNGAPLKEASKLKAALESRISNRPLSDLNFTLFFDEDSNGEFVSDVLSVLTELGVKSVDLIDL